MEREQLIRKAKLVKVVKSYTIAFTYAGIRQYADFNEIDGGILFNPQINVQYARNLQIPTFEENTTIEQVLDVIKEKIDKNATIQYINRLPVTYYNNTVARELTQKFNDNLEEFITKHTIEFFKTVLQPIMKANKWVLTSSHIGMPVIGEFNENNEIDNIQDKDKEFEFEYICYQFINSVEPNAEANLRSQYGRSTADAFQYLQKYIPLDYFKENGLYYQND